MKNEDKIKLADQLIVLVRDLFSSKDMPILIGYLNKAQGIVGFKKADIGHPVFEYKGRYIIYLERNDGQLTIEVGYNKNTLEATIDKLWI